jgi:hypothetical protein
MVKETSSLESYQNIDASILQYFEPDPSQQNIYSGTLGAKAKVHFYQQARGIDIERVLELYLPLEEKQQHVVWKEAIEEELGFDRFPSTAPSNAKFHLLPEVILEDKRLAKAARELAETLYRQQNLELFRCTSSKLESKAEESRSDFMVRLQDDLNEKKESEIEKLQMQYGKKEKVLLDRLSRANERVEKEAADSTGSMIEAGIAVLGALFGRTTPTKIGRAVSKGGKILKERGEMSRAEERIDMIEQQIQALEYELEDKIDALNEKYSVDNCEIETFSVKPRKSDIDVEICAVVWRISDT